MYHNKITRHLKNIFSFLWHQSHALAINTIIHLLVFYILNTCTKKLILQQAGIGNTIFGTIIVNTLVVSCCNSLMSFVILQHQSRQDISNK